MKKAVIKENMKKWEREIPDISDNQDCNDFQFDQ